MLDQSRGTKDFRFEIPNKAHGICADSPPPLWPAESSLLLPKSYHLSPKSRTNAIKAGRQQLMEMVKDISESSFELSLKDIIEPQKHDREETISKDGNFHSDGNGSEKLRKSKSMQNMREKPKHIFRSASMETEVFLIKMFPRLFPKTKSKVSIKKTIKVSTRSSFNEPESVAQDQNTGKNRTISNSIGRHKNGTSLPDCWSLFHFKKSTSSRNGWIV
ncbi:hypothetical protein ACFE04_018875 [Oxalis oulophora]